MRNGDDVPWLSSRGPSILESILSDGDDPWLSIRDSSSSSLVYSIIGELGCVCLEPEPGVGAVFRMWSKEMKPCSEIVSGQPPGIRLHKNHNPQSPGFVVYAYPTTSTLSHLVLYQQVCTF